MISSTFGGNLFGWTCVLLSSLFGSAFEGNGKIAGRRYDLRKVGYEGYFDWCIHFRALCGLAFG
jgi:hypothetical protein